MSRVIVGVVAGAVIFAAVVSLAALLIARSELQAGSTDLRLAVRQVQSPGNGSGQTTSFAAAQDTVRRAQYRFDRAAAFIGPFSPLLERAGWVPWIGGDLSAASPGVATAQHVSHATTLLLNGLVPAADVVQSRLATSSRLSRVLAVLVSHESEFRQAAAELHMARRDRRAIHEHLSGSLAANLVAFDRDVSELQLATRILIAAPTLLGWNPPVRYLIAYQNTDELRATGGFIGSVGLLSVDKGTVRENFTSTWFAHQNYSTPPPDPLLLYNRESAWIFMDSNWSPNFPTSAELEEYFFRLNTGAAVDGVIDVTPRAAANVLAATGPLYVKEYGRWVSAANVTGLADYYAHWSPETGPFQFVNKDTQRKQFIGIVARHLMGHLSQLGFNGWGVLIRALATTVAHQDIQLYFNDPSGEGLLRSARAAGAINPTTTDYLDLTDSNLSYNKVNPYVHISLRYDVHIGVGRWTSADLTLTFTNGPVPAALSSRGYGPGAGQYGKPDDYADFVRIYVPPGAQLLSQDGWAQAWTPGDAYGKTMFSGYLLVPAGSTQIVRLHYLLPPNIFSASHGQRYRLFLQHQPGSRLDRVTVRVHHDGQSTAWSQRNLQEDWSRTTAIAPRTIHPIPLPHWSDPIVAPGNWIEPHAYLAPPGTAVSEDQINR